jgi:hypothetical protein
MLKNTSLIVYCATCGHDKVPAFSPEGHGEPCLTRFRLKQEGIENFAIGFRCLLKDDVDMDAHGTTITLRSGSARIRLQVEEVQYE